MAVLTACEGPQSALRPAGREAETVADLFWIMTVGAVAIWVFVIGLAFYATRLARRRQHSERASRLLIVGGGVVFPVTVLAALLGYGLYLIPELRASADSEVEIWVSGERWWWRVRYRLPDGSWVASANEVRLPAGESVAINLTSPDVIHSFWIPPLAGKLDMIPGRVNRLILKPTETGIYRGACAEFCGTSHAYMNFAAVVMEPEAFDAWLAHIAEPAQPPADELAARGKALFLANGCGACHTVRGTPATGGIGPDLTHVGSRLTLGAGILPNEVDQFVRWTRAPKAVKPDVNMPGYHMLPEQDLIAIATYLEGLQ